ncbi:uncharacterized protein LOC110924925 [Helianthus annuus]|uniref:uncharacterized protein LOC110924925 n=1 Tax=Helianthus annuus TaxID=4232 RepID=UPI000B9007F9|nr:uncharacterized protein LOC110924925 [Helianthus annuus]
MLSFVDNWRCGLSTVEELSEYRGLQEMIPKCSFSGGKDSWVWNADSSNSFSVQNVKKILMNDRNVRRVHNMVWTGWVPLKVNIHAWRLDMDRLSTKINLRRRNINVGDGSCVLCQSVEESALHLFTGCIVSSGVWQGIEKWRCLGPIFLFDIKDIFSLPSTIPGTNTKKKIIRRIVMTTCWVIWKSRNKAVFEDAKPLVCDMIACIKSWSYLWFRSRSKVDNISWKDWCRYPMYML